MDQYIVAVFDTESQAADALHAIWRLDAAADITVHGAAVVRRNSVGTFDVASKHTDPGLRTALGISLGALIGALAGPAGAAAGVGVATAVAAGTGIGAVTGGMIGGTADIVKSAEHEEAAVESRVVVGPGQSAVIAEVDESWTTPIDNEVKRLGGRVYRRAESDVANELFDARDYNSYLYPYDYAPSYVN